MIWGREIILIKFKPLVFSPHRSYSLHKDQMTLHHICVSKAPIIRSGTFHMLLFIKHMFPVCFSFLLSCEYFHTDSTWLVTQNKRRIVKNHTTKSPLKWNKSSSNWLFSMHISTHTYNNPPKFPLSISETLNTRHFLCLHHYYPSGINIS